jgi:hypothetical protein
VSEVALELETQNPTAKERKHHRLMQCSLHTPLPLQFDTSPRLAVYTALSNSAEDILHEKSEFFKFVEINLIYFLLLDGTADCLFY